MGQGGWLHVSKREGELGMCACGVGCCFYPCATCFLSVLDWFCCLPFRNGKFGPMFCAFKSFLAIENWANYLGWS